MEVTFGNRSSNDPKIIFGNHYSAVAERSFHVGGDSTTPPTPPNGLESPFSFRRRVCEPKTLFGRCYRRPQIAAGLSGVKADRPDSIPLNPLFERFEAEFEIVRGIFHHTRE